MTDIPPKFALCNRCVGAPNDDSSKTRAASREGDFDDRSVLDGRMSTEDACDLVRLYAIPSYLHEATSSADEFDFAIFDDSSDVSCTKGRAPFGVADELLMRIYTAAIPTRYTKAADPDLAEVIGRLAITARTMRPGQSCLLTRPRVGCARVAQS